MGALVVWFIFLLPGKGWIYKCAAAFPLCPCFWRWLGLVVVPGLCGCLGLCMFIVHVVTLSCLKLRTYLVTVLRGHSLCACFESQSTNAFRVCIALASLMVAVLTHAAHE